MSAGSSSARNSHLAQWGRTTMKPYLRTDLFIAEQSIIIKKTTTQPLKEGVTTIFTVVYLYLDSIFCDHLACVASVSNRVIVRKFERKQKKRFSSPSPVIHFFFCSCPSFLDEPREETLATQASDHFILHCHIILFTGMNIIVVRSP